MSTSNAIPVLRTPDLRLAHQAARRLLDLAVHWDKGVAVSASVDALTLAEAQRMTAAFPTAVLGPEDPFRRESHQEVRDLVVLTTEVGDGVHGLAILK
ncbi:hypothetical protein ACFZDG_30235 [Kitasatospora xanthocidica]|uniref:hypothetical protein n=1 Tax=Kitasatospora xanthocidica TaxID=83382 RepID=UPI0036DFAAA2